MIYKVLLVCAIVNEGLKSVDTRVTYCNATVPAARLCQSNSISGNFTVYLDTAGIPLYQRARCTCMLRVPRFLWWSYHSIVTVTPLRADPGDISLEVDGFQIDMAHSNGTRLPYRQRMEIRFEKNSDARETIQCFEFKIDDYPFRGSVQCMSMLQTTFPTSRSTPTESTLLTTNITTSENIGDEEQEKDSPKNLIAVYAVVSNVAVLIIALIVGALLIRRRKRSRGKLTEQPDYVNAVNLDKTTVSNADCVHLYDNESTHQVESNEQSYEGLEPQRERANIEHTYSGLGPERDLTNTNNNGNLSENDHESNRHVYGNDYMSAETQRTKEHPYSELEPRCGCANITYENTDSAYENQEGLPTKKHL